MNPGSRPPAPGEATITFLGAAGEVTGSCYRVDAAGASFLVDCGMFQGGREADDKNAGALDFDAGALDFVILTHAHIDHSGLLPRLCALGFSGPIYATPATVDLVGVMLPDSAHIQEKEAEWSRQRNRGPGRSEDANRDRRHAGRRALGGGARTMSTGDEPLYGVADAERCLRQFRGVGYDVEAAPHPAVRFRFRDAGHSPARRPYKV